ncbi:Alg9-like mannosyltransferase family-domain-containing protein [Syncephalis pseudoplumigaleata]|uniref:Mannosyltransferase n=1 Tax=Syncephalis pseudoplumigaleata TaxID=1712513 RepID=A0A4P9YWG6_9FUNG|nr:Alg9-like mannosyltransferase family-domain-containing protein [Syncephalis pseudoplumigaleata]|eukprot:RKP23280.1 Alg9-like mannosyltransferase family-domain-containing protein [Syncephalis pseudoplumigaleata]
MKRLPRPRFWWFVLFRLVNGALTHTYGYPDEYWQAQEVAHRSVFGYGYLTWEWRERIRSILHPWCFALAYQLAVLLRLDQPALVQWMPTILQAVVAAIGDWYTVRMARQWFTAGTAQWAMWFSLLSWCHWLHAPRTLANSMEMSLSTMALYYWPWPVEFAKDAAHQMRLLAFGVMALADYYYYGEWTCVPYNFIHANVVRGVSLFYGQHPWHWYATQGVPTVLTTFLPLAIYGIRRASAVHRTAAYASIWLLGIYSMLAHKEFRFIYPIVPVGIIYAAYGAQHLWQSAAVQSSRTWRAAFIGAIVLPNLVLSLLFVSVHQRGVLDAMDWLRQQPADKLSGIGYLMPCHSTPFWSRLHRRIPMWFITCEPPTSASAMAEYKSEQDVFYADPAAFLNARLQTLDAQSLPREPASTAELDRMAERRWWPSHLLLFDALLPAVNETLGAHGYHECSRFFNSFFHDDERRIGDVLVYCTHAANDQ